MNNQYYFILIIFSGLLLLSSCGWGDYYRTESIHFLGVDDKDDIVVSGSSHIDFVEGWVSEKNSYFQIQGAYSPVKHLAFATSASLRRQPKPNVLNFNGYDFDVAVGAYTSFDIESRRKKLGKESLLFDGYLSYGQGELTKKRSFITVSENTLSFNRYAFQMGMHYESNFGEKLNKILRVGIVYKPSILVFTKFTNTGAPLFDEYRYADSLMENNKRFMHETGLQAQFGTKAIQCFLNYNGTKLRSIEELADTRIYQFGVIFNINEFIAK